LWSERVKPSDSQKNFGTIWRKQYYAKEDVSMAGKVPNSQQVSLMNNAWAIQPLHEQHTMLNE
jgi:hypothetical protein